MEIKDYICNPILKMGIGQLPQTYSLKLYLNISIIINTMKKLLFAFLPLMLLCACGLMKKSPEEEVRNYGKYFVEKLSANQLDSLINSYPDLAKADSIVPVQSDTIIVAETAPGQFDLTLEEGIVLKVSRDDDGNITVTESRGLFAFPADKVEIAKKTGMWTKSLNDADLADRMKDEEFFDYIKNSKEIRPNSLISIGKFINNGNGAGYYPVTNNTDVAISGNDYNFIVTQSYPTYIPGSMAIDEWVTKESEEKGRDLPPNGTEQFYSTTNRSFVAGELDPEKKLKGVKFNLSQEELQSRFASFTGNEYKEYLDSKK